MKFKCYDTCSLLKEAGHLFTSDDYTLIISSIVLEELEDIKSRSNRDADVKFAARKVLQDLDTHYGSYEIIIYQDSYADSFIEAGFTINNDIKIISCALYAANNLHRDDEVIFVTNDLICRHIASMYLPVEQVIEEDYDYDGYKEVYLNEEEVSNFYSHMNENLYGLFIKTHMLTLLSKQDLL